MKSEEKILCRDLKPDAQAFDEIRIVTVPRFKQSGLSGDEWRISAKIQFYRNGVAVHEEHGGRDVQTTVHLLGYYYLNAIDNGKGHYGGEGDFCDQEGCAERATVILEKLKEGCGRCGTVKDAGLYSRPFRKFCERHKRRGDSSLDDNDNNYKQIGVQA